MNARRLGFRDKILFLLENNTLTYHVRVLRAILETKEFSRILEIHNKAYNSPFRSRVLNKFTFWRLLSTLEDGTFEDIEHALHKLATTDNRGDNREKLDREHKKRILALWERKLFGSQSDASKKELMRLHSFLKATRGLNSRLGKRVQHRLFPES